MEMKSRPQNKTKTKPEGDLLDGGGRTFKNLPFHKSNENTGKNSKKINFSKTLDTNLRCATTQGMFTQEKWPNLSQIS